MELSLDCYPCLLHQTLDAVRLVTDDIAVHDQVLRKVCQMCADLDLKTSAPAIAQQIHRLIRKTTGNLDPYYSLKQQFNRYAMQLRDDYKQRNKATGMSFEDAVRLSIVGNVIDFGACRDMTEAQATEIISHSFEKPIRGHVDRLQHDIQQADRILFLADNAGEIALDMLFVEQMPRDKVTVAVRGHPVLNDATIEDAEMVGMTKLVTVIDNGSDAPGTILSDCSPAFREAFERADVIISKGQGNYESLSDLTNYNLYFLLTPKCDLIAKNVGYSRGDLVAQRVKGLT